MANEGWIKLYRQLQESPLWNSEKFTRGQAWIDLLLLANHRDNQILFDGNILEVKRGQILTSILKLSEKWMWNRKTVSSYLNMLEKEKMITKCSDNRKTIITIENYEVYQFHSDVDWTTGRTTVGQQDGQLWDNRTDTNNNVKNDKNNSMYYTHIHNACEESDSDIDIDALMKTDIPLTIRRS